MKRELETYRVLDKTTIKCTFSNTTFKSRAEIDIELNHYFKEKENLDQKIKDLQELIEALDNFEGGK